MGHEEHEIPFTTGGHGRMGISGTFSVKASSMVRYICTICISDSKLSCGETPAFTNTLTTFSGTTIFLRFDTTCSNTLSMNTMSGSVSGYGRLFHIASLSLINLHRISPMCRSVIFSGLTSAAEHPFLSLWACLMDSNSTYYGRQIYQQ